MFLTLEHLSKIFVSRDGTGQVRAVDDVSLVIQQGEFVTLLGPSGCGKTTTLRLIAGFEFPTEGRIVLDGGEINELPPNRRDMAMVFQSYALFPHLSVFDNIAYGLKIKKLPATEVRRLVSRVMDLAELTGLENRAPNQLSGGQQQRVALARALVMEPKVLLFDEPLSNLDAKLRVQMRSEIRRIQQELDITSVYVTHDQDEAMALSDRIVVMHNGRIRQAGSAVTIYRRPVNRFVADFIGRANFLDATVMESRAGEATIKIFDQQIDVPAATDAGLSAGGGATLMARPESIHLHPATDDPAPAAPGASQEAKIQGRILSRTYLGAQVEYALDVHGQRVVAVHHDPGETDLLPEGSLATVTFLQENLYLLPNDDLENAPIA